MVDFNAAHGSAIYQFSGSPEVGNISLTDFKIAFPQDALLNKLIVLHLLSGADYLKEFSAEQLDAFALFFLEAHSIGYALGLVFFGLSILVAGYLIFKSGYFPRILGLLLMAAAAGYLIDSFAHVLLFDYDDYEDVFGLVVFAPAFIAELSLCLWLLVKGINVPPDDQQAPAAD